MSDILITILKERKGYRNNNFQNSGITSLKEILNHEVKELGNEDIFDSMKKLYPDFKCDYNSINTKISYTLNFIARYLECSINDINAVWLTTKDNAKKLYTYSDSDIINCVKIPKNSMPISDLGCDGILFAYTGQIYS